MEEIDKSIDAAERNPQRFNLSQQELSDRRKWVMSTRRQMGSLSSGLSAAANGSALAVADSTPTGRLAAAVHEENDRFIHSEGDRQQMLMRWVGGWAAGWLGGWAPCSLRALLCGRPRVAATRHWGYLGSG